VELKWFDFTVGFFGGISRQPEGYHKIFHNYFLTPRLSVIGLYILTVIEDESWNAESLNVLAG